MRITITRALAELKTLKLRYQKEATQLNPVAVARGLKLCKPFSSYTVESFKEEALAKFQSVEALRKRIVAIKTAIDNSNFTTIVKIGDVEMTVQEAIVKKNLIPFQEVELRQLKACYSRATTDYDNALEENAEYVKRVVSEQSSKSSTPVKTDVKELEQNAKDMVEKLYKVEMVDPIGIAKKIEALEKEISDFQLNVDYVLSESNSSTFIEIED